MAWKATGSPLLEQGYLRTMNIVLQWTHLKKDSHFQWTLWRDPEKRDLPFWESEAALDYQVIPPLSWSYPLSLIIVAYGMKVPKLFLPRFHWNVGEKFIEIVCIRENVENVFILKHHCKIWLYYMLNILLYAWNIPSYCYFSVNISLENNMALPLMSLPNLQRIIHHSNLWAEFQYGCHFFQEVIHVDLWYQYGSVNVKREGIWMATVILGSENCISKHNL